MPVVAEPLQVVVRCWTSPADTAPAATHAVTLQPDGSLSTPHDLPAERIAAAFGGYLSCLELVDRVVPALEGWWRLQTRDALPPLRRAARGSWRPTPAAAADCCTSVPSAAQASAHLRTPQHLARQAGLPLRLVRPLTDALLATSAAVPAPDEVQDAARCVRAGRGAGGRTVSDLWEAGLHPRVLRTIHDRVVGPDGPALPPALYLGALTRRADLAWVARTLHQVADAAGGPLPEQQEADLAEWLLATGSRAHGAERDRRAAWLALGIPRTWVVDLARAGYHPDDAVRLAAGTGRPVPGAVHQLRAWLAAGLEPSVDDLLALHALGLPAWYSPSRAAVDRLCEALHALPDPPPRTRAALVLAGEGTVDAAAQVLLAGPVPPFDHQQECA